MTGRKPEQNKTQRRWPFAATTWEGEGRQERWRERESEREERGKGETGRTERTVFLKWKKWKNILLMQINTNFKIIFKVINTTDVKMCPRMQSKYKMVMAHV